jgi:protein-S-isoprenylcysteine O-methyltransferase Ste14
VTDRPGVIAPPPLIFAVFLAIGWLTRGLLPLAPPEAVWIGAGIAIVGIAFAIWGRTTMQRAGTNINPYQPAIALVTSGPFAWTRNPLYVSLTILYAGLALVARSWTALLLLPVVLIIMDAGVIRREERYLEAKFGEAYRAYRGSVRRWV